MSKDGLLLLITHHLHYHFTLAPAVELAQENSLPATEKEFAVGEGDGDAWAYERGLYVRVGVLFGVSEAHAVLGQECAKGMEHVARNVGVCVLVDCEARGRVSNVESADAVARARLAQAAAHLVTELDQLLALARAHPESVRAHVRILQQSGWPSTAPVRSGALLPELEVGGDELQRDDFAVGLGARVRRGAVGDDGGAFKFARAAGQHAAGLRRVGGDLDGLEAAAREVQHAFAVADGEDEPPGATLDAHEHARQARLARERLAQRIVDGGREGVGNHLVLRTGRLRRRLPVLSVHVNAFAQDEARAVPALLVRLALGPVALGLLLHRLDGAEY